MQPKEILKRNLIVAGVLIFLGCFADSLMDGDLVRDLLWTLSVFLIGIGFWVYLFHKSCQFCRRLIPGKSVTCNHCGQNLYAVHPVTGQVISERRATAPVQDRSSDSVLKEIGSLFFERSKTFIKIYLSLVGGSALVLFIAAFYILLNKEDRDVNPNQKQLIEAVRQGNLESVKILAPKVSTLDFTQGVPPLYAAAGAGQSEIAEYLLDQGANPDQKVVNQDGMTALMRAIEKHRLDVVKVLISRGASIDLQDSLGRTPMHLAIRKNHSDIALYLLKKGAHLNIPDKMGDTALQIARYMKRAWLFEALQQGRVE